VTVACCLLSHVDDPIAVLGELARVTRPGGVVAVTAFPAGDQHPVKAVVDGVLRECGYRPPEWYSQVKSLGETRVGSPVRLAELGTAAGLSTMDISVCQARLDDLAVDALVAWRLGMPAVTDWLATVDNRERVALRRRLALAITDTPPLHVLVAIFTR
jgi:SAM-dependent methyltransferase